MISLYHDESPRQTLLPSSLVHLGKHPLFIVCAYEGTLAPSSLNSELSLPHPRARNALAALIGHPKHQVALLSSLPDWQLDSVIDLPPLSRIALPDGSDVVGDEVLGLNKSIGICKALEQLMTENPFHHLIFIAEDASNEAAFEWLELLGGTAIKVGRGKTQAAFQMDGPDDVVDLLEVWVQFSR